MCSYLLQLNHIQIRFHYWYPLSLLISDIAIDNNIRYKSAKGSKTGERWLVGFEIRYKVTIKTDSFTKTVLERYKDKAKTLYIEPKEEEI